MREQEDRAEAEGARIARRGAGPGRPPGALLQGLREARVRRRLTLRGLGQLSGLEPNNISQLENLRHGADEKTVYALAEALDVSVEQLKYG